MTQRVSKGKAAQNAQVKARRRSLVRKGIAQCITVLQIQQLLSSKGINVSKKTIDRDIKVVKNELQKEIEKSRLTLDQILQEFFLSYDETYAELWKLYRDPKHPKAAKGKLLELISKHREQKKDYLQSLGLLKAQTADQRIEVVWGGEETDD